MLNDVIQESCTTQHQIIIKGLETGNAVLQDQSNRYKSAIWELELVRWHNKLKPVIDNMNYLTDEKCEQYLNELVEIQSQGNLILQRWEQTDIAFTVQCQTNIKRLRQALSTCEKMRGEFRAKQAALVLKEINPIERTKPVDLLSNQVITDINIFNVLPDVDMFSSGFKELENEYFRIQAEDELIRT